MNSCVTTTYLLHNQMLLINWVLLFHIFKRIFLFDWLIIIRIYNWIILIGCTACDTQIELVILNRWVCWSLAEKVMKTFVIKLWNKEIKLRSINCNARNISRFLSGAATSICHFFCPSVRPSVALYIPGTVHHLIIIFGTHM